MRRYDNNPISPVMAVLAAAFSELVWALVLALPGNSMDGYVFRYMDSVGGDLLWAGIFFTVSMTQMWRLVSRLKGEWVKHAILIDLMIGYISASLWTFVSLLCLFSTYPPSPFVGSTLALAAGMWFECFCCSPSAYDRRRNRVEETVRKFDRRAA